VKVAFRAVAVLAEARQPMGQAALVVEAKLFLHILD
jgi:hypothetical protein